VSKLKLRCCGCLLVIVLFLLLLCVLVYLALNRPGSAHAQVSGANCVASAGASALELAPGISEPRAASVARGIFFVHETIITITGQATVCLASSADGRGDLRVDDRLELNVIHADGSTAAWQHDFGDSPTGGITTESPQDMSTLFTPGVNRVHLVLRDTRPPVYSARPIWLIVLPLPSPTPTPLPSPTALPTTSMPLSLIPSPTSPSPAETPAPQVTSTSSPATAAAHKPRSYLIAWPVILIGGIVLAGIIALVCRARVKRPPAKELPVGDNGALEVCDTQTGDVERIELSELGLGEVWGIGNSPNCRIHAGREMGEEEYAALILTPDGPVIKSRSKPIWFDDKPITEHLLFDGDDVFVGRFVLAYQNFFRRRGVNLEDDAEEGIGET
jgi:hypothetical protein